MSAAENESASPRIPGLEPEFRHIDDQNLPWMEVRSQQNADGSRASVWEKWFTFAEDPTYLSLYAKYDPGMIVRRHGHLSPHVVFVLEGDLWVGERHCPAGTHIDLPLGAVFGPLRAGDDGAVLFEVMMGDPRSWSDEPEAFASALAEHGAIALAHPPHVMPQPVLERRRQVSEARRAASR
jgi:hypothetical protein